MVCPLRGSQFVNLADLLSQATRLQTKTRLNVRTCVRECLTAYLQLISTDVIAWLLLQLGIWSDLCCEKTWKVEHGDFGGWEQIRNTDTFWFIMLRDLKSHGELKTKSCESVDSVQLTRMKTYYFVLCVAGCVVQAGAPSKAVPNRTGLAVLHGWQQYPDLIWGRRRLKLWTSKRVLTNEGSSIRFRID